jgi:hypothetical protein
VAVTIPAHDVQSRTPANARPTVLDDLRIVEDVEVRPLRGPPAGAESTGITHEIAVNSALYAVAVAALSPAGRRAVLDQLRGVAVGDRIICGDQVRSVTEIRTHLPGAVPEAAQVADGYLAHELVTDAGSRWWGELPGEAPACRLCRPERGDGGLA